MAENHYSVFENGVEPSVSRGISRNRPQPPKEQYGFEVKRGIKSSSFAAMNSPLGERRSIKHKPNWAAIGSGMQAIFLGPTRKSCGTGVFIPRGQGIDLKLSDKPAFSPVLLPCRVIQTLNLNVHDLGQHTKPQSEQNKNDREIKNEENLEKQKEEDISFSPEIILPKEWTY